MSTSNDYVLVPHDIRKCQLLYNILAKHSPAALVQSAGI